MFPQVVDASKAPAEVVSGDDAMEQSTSAGREREESYAVVEVALPAPAPEIPLDVGEESVEQREWQDELGEAQLDLGVCREGGWHDWGVGQGEGRVEGRGENGRMSFSWT